MCGIVGVASSSSNKETSWLDRGRDSLQHRGPDGAGTWWSSDNRVGLAHRRLSIIDLSDHAKQPMVSLTGRFVVTFNGEIYNHLELKKELSSLGVAFRSTSDTEVLLAAFETWGIESIQRLNGMFAFAIYDTWKSKLFLVRDRAGEKPLFYRLVPGDEVRFASELKALLCDTSLSRSIDHTSLDCFLSMGYVPGDLCIWKGANKLPPAHFLEFDCNNGNSDVWRYWRIPDLVEDCSEPEVLVDRFESLLEDSVRRQLVADVPVGVLLSGGVDSSLVAAMASRALPQVRTFTVGNPGSELDETCFARLIANHFDTDHTELQIGDVTPSLLVRLAEQYDEPINDSSMLPTYLVCELIRQQCTVALGGDGGDELFGGYRSHDRMALLQSRLGFVPNSFRRVIGALSSTFLSDGIRGKEFLQSVSFDPSLGLPLFSGQFSLRERQRMFGSHPLIAEVAETIRHKRVPHLSDAVQRITRFDFENYMAEDILVKVDRASMLTSLEVRSPFLDLNLIEFAYRDVPSVLKAVASSRKILPKKLAARLFPSSFDTVRKQGFGVPIGRWLQESQTWKQLVQSTLLSDDCVFSQDFIVDLIEKQKRHLLFTSRLFGLLVFELWRKHYGFSL